jgi:hypothetical protein
MKKQIGTNHTREGIGRGRQPAEQVDSCSPRKSVAIAATRAVRGMRLYS